MPRPSSFSHEITRRLICVCCAVKLKPNDVDITGPSPNSGSLIDEKMEKLLKLHVTEEFSRGDQKFPVSLCIACKINLENMKSNPK